MSSRQAMSIALSVIIFPSTLLTGWQEGDRQTDRQARQLWGTRFVAKKVRLAVGHQLFWYLSFQPRESINGNLSQEGEERSLYFHANYETRSEYHWMLLPDVSPHEYYLLWQYFTRRRSDRNHSSHFPREAEKFYWDCKYFHFCIVFISEWVDRWLMSELKCRTNKRDEIVSPLTTRTSFTKLLLSKGIRRRRTTSRDIKAATKDRSLVFHLEGGGDSCTSTYTPIENPCLNLSRIHSQ